MPVSISDPKLTIKDRIKAGWNAAAVLNVIPAFHTGFLNPGGDQFQVCFPDTTEVTPFPSGFDAIGADGPVSRRLGTVPCMIFARRAATGSQNAINPKKFLSLARMEVERIVHAAVVAEPDFEYMSVIASAAMAPDTEYEPPFFGWTVMIHYVWRKTLT